MKIAPKAIRDEMAGRPVSPAQILYVDLFNVLPGHDACQAYPSVVFAQSAAKRLKKLFGRMSGWRIKQQPAIAEVFGILSNAQNKAGNSTVSQDSQGIGYASPAVALTVLRPSALG